MSDRRAAYGTACDRCRKGKRKCDGQMPCSRCKRLQVTCTRQPTPAQMSKSGSSVSNSQYDDTLPAPYSSIHSLSDVNSIAPSSGALSFSGSIADTVNYQTEYGTTGCNTPYDPRAISDALDTARVGHSQAIALRHHASAAAAAAPVMSTEWAAPFAIASRPLAPAWPGTAVPPMPKEGTLPGVQTGPLRLNAGLMARMTPGAARVAQSLPSMHAMQASLQARSAMQAAGMAYPGNMVPVMPGGPQAFLAPTSFGRTPGSAATVPAHSQVVPRPASFEGRSNTWWRPEYHISLQVMYSALCQQAGLAVPPECVADLSAALDCVPGFKWFVRNRVDPEHLTAVQAHAQQAAAERSAALAAGTMPPPVPYRDMPIVTVMQVLSAWHAEQGMPVMVMTRWHTTKSFVLSMTSAAIELYGLNDAKRTQGHAQRWEAMILQPAASLHGALAILTALVNRAVYTQTEYGLLRATRDEEGVKFRPFASLVHAFHTYFPGTLDLQTAICYYTDLLWGQAQWLSEPEAHPLFSKESGPTVLDLLASPAEFPAAAAIMRAYGLPTMIETLVAAQQTLVIPDFSTIVLALLSLAAPHHAAVRALLAVVKVPDYITDKLRDFLARATLEQQSQLLQVGLSEDRMLRIIQAIVLLQGEELKPVIIIDGKQIMPTVS